MHVATFWLLAGLWTYIDLFPPAVLRAFKVGLSLQLYVECHTVWKLYLLTLWTPLACVDRVCFAGSARYQ